MLRIPKNILTTFISRTLFSNGIRSLWGLEHKYWHEKAIDQNVFCINILPLGLNVNRKLILAKLTSLPRKCIWYLFHFRKGSYLIKGKQLSSKQKYLLSFWWLAQLCWTKGNEPNREQIFCHVIFGIIFKLKVQSCFPFHF